MFERKNQKFEHYNKLVDQDEVDSNSGDDFITLKREDHGLSSDSEGHREDNLSRRKLKMSKSKRAMLKSTDLGKKLVFDEEGNPHELYEMQDADEFFRAGPESVKEAGKIFVEGEKGRLRTADVLDKEEAKEKKREKKRKRKEREKGVSGFSNSRFDPLNNDVFIRMRWMRRTKLSDQFLHHYRTMTVITHPTSTFRQTMMKVIHLRHQNAPRCQWQASSNSPVNIH